GTSVGGGENIRTGSEVDRVLAGGRRRGHPVETLAACGVADAEIIVVARRIGGDDGIRRRRRNRRGLQLRDGELPRSWRYPEKNVRIQQNRVSARIWLSLLSCLARGLLLPETGAGHRALCRSSRNRSVCLAGRRIAVDRCPTRLHRCVLPI